MYRWWYLTNRNVQSIFLWLIILHFLLTNCNLQNILTKVLNFTFLDIHISRKEWITPPVFSRYDILVIFKSFKSPSIYNKLLQEYMWLCFRECNTCSLADKTGSKTQIIVLCDRVNTFIGQLVPEAFHTLIYLKCM